jgi:hypothetical protein
MSRQLRANRTSLSAKVDLTGPVGGVKNVAGESQRHASSRAGRQRKCERINASGNAGRIDRRAFELDACGVLDQQRYGVRILARAVREHYPDPHDHVGRSIVSDLDGYAVGRWNRRQTKRDSADRIAAVSALE